MKVLITGGAGFIGSHIADLFEEKGYKVTILDNLSTGSKNNLFGRKLIKGDIRNLASIKKAVKDQEYIIHHAAAISVPESMENPLLYNDVNVTGTANVLEAAKYHKVKKVVFASSAAVYGEAKVPISEDSSVLPTSVYGLTKLISEQQCAFYTNAFGLNTVSLRYFNVFGPRQDPHSPYAAAIPHFINKYLNKQKAKIFGDGKQTRDFIYVKNVALANLKAIEKEKANGAMMNIASGNHITVNKLVRDISPSLKYVHAPARKGDIKHSYADISFSKRILGNYNKTPFNKALKETLEFYSTQK